jgi:myosin heavy subunit
MSALDQLKDVKNRLTTATGDEKAQLEQEQAQLLEQIMNERKAKFDEILQQPIADRVQSLQTLKDELEADKEAWDTNFYNQVVNRLSEDADALAQQQEKEQRYQMQQEVIDNAVDDVLPEIFEALLPQDTYAEILGLTNYGELRQQFYQLCRAYTAEQVQTVSQQYELELAQKDEKIRLLNKQSLEVQQQLDAANAQIAELTKQLQDERDAHDKTQADLAAVRAQLNTALSDNAAKDEKIADLQAKAQSKAEPSANLQDMITQIKSKNTLSAAEKAARALARFYGDHPELAAPKLEVPTAPATFPDAQSQNGTVSNGDSTASDTTIQSSVNQFQGTNPPALTSDQSAGVPVDQGAQGQNDSSLNAQGQAPTVVTRAEIDYINARLDRLERQANLPELEKAS